MDGSDPREQRIAELLGQRYELLELLDRGGFASVYRVRNLRLHRVEALKVLSELFTEDPDFARRFEQEAHVAAALDHPHIVKIYDYAASERFCWFSMQFIDGPSLGRELKQGGRFEQSRAARIAVAVLDALAYSHARGVIHRDIKPDNVLLDSESRPYLTDFGVAKSESALVKTHAGTLLGSPAYMSPEQLQGKSLDGRSDLYSVGVTIYKVLAGELPFSGEDTMRATLRRISEPATRLSAKRADVHPKLEAIVMRALERDPAARFQGAREMRDAIEDFLAEVTPARTAAPAIEEDAAQTLVLPGSPRPSRATAPEALRGEPPPPPQAPSARASTTLARRRDSLGWILAAVAIGAAATAALLFLRSGTAPRAAAPQNRAPNPPTVANARATPVPTVESVILIPSPEPTVFAAAASPEVSPAAPVLPAPERATRRRRASPAAPNVAVAAPVPTAVPTPEPAPTAPIRHAYAPPELESQAPLLLSSAARAAHGNELVGLSLIVAADGTVKSARVVSETAACPECDRAALSAARRFRFRAARDGEGRPIEAPIAISIRIPPL